MDNWAENEIKLACKKENPDWDGESFDYGCACYQSALKAYKSLCEDGHSGLSMGFTKDILNRLIGHRCLTPIEDTEDVWHEGEDRDSEYVSYQCNRQSSLFKDVYPDGTVKYHDVDRAILIDQNGIGWHSGLSSRLIDELYPITMPYYPLSEPYKVYAEEFLVDPANGDYDTIGITHLITPEGVQVEVNYYKAEKDGEMVDISKEEYEERKRNRVNK